jgi:hypothetical protein
MRGYRQYDLFDAVSTIAFYADGYSRGSLTMGVSDAIRDWILSPVMLKLTEIQKEIQTMSTSQTQMDAVLTQLGTVVTNEDSVISTVLTAISTLLAKVAAGQTGADLTNEATAMQSMIADIQAQTASLSAAVASATTPPTPTA